MTQLSKELFQKIKRIQIETTLLANDLLAGAWHSAFKGRGMEFEEVREYIPGDEVRDIDWNVTARMNVPYVKRFHEERELTVMLVVDVSASTHFGSTGESKAERIAEIGAALAFSAIKNNDKVGLILFSDEVELYIPPKQGTRHVLRVIRELLAFEPKHRGTNLSQALHYLGNTQVKKGICFLITDYLCPTKSEELSAIAKKHELISIVVTDPYELEFPKLGWVTLHDLELEKTVTFNSNRTNAFSEKSRDRLESHKKMMQKIGAGFIDVRTNEPYVLPLKRFFKLRRIKH